MQAEIPQGNVLDRYISASFGSRLAAWIIDSVIITVPVLFMFLLLPMGLAYALAAIFSIGYPLWFWTSTGQTPGKMMMGLRVVSAQTGDILEPGQAVIRYVGYIVGYIPFYLGFLWCIWDPYHDAWHDKIARTKVIKL